MDTVFGILGTTTLLVEGRLIDNWGTPRERAVLATLLAHPGRPMPINLLIEWAWPRDTQPPRYPTSTFYTYANRIRRSFDLLPPGVAPSPTLRASNGAYQLEVNKDLIDYYQFHRLIADARAHERDNRPQRTLELTEQALELWRGFPLADVASERADAWRLRIVQGEWLPAQSMLIEALLSTLRFGEAIAQLDEIQADYPADVTLAAQRLSALHGLVRFGEADAYYLTTRQRLLAEGDDQAADHLRSHQESLRAQAGRLRTKAGVASAVTNPVPRQLPRDIPHFVGRTQQVEALRAVSDVASEGTRGRIVIVDGMAGVGKTTLAVHWAHWARDLFPDGDLFVDLNGFSDGQLVQSAAVVDDFLIALGYPPDHTMSARSRELLLSHLLSERKILVILDNARNTTHVHDLVSLMANTFVIVTSRQRLRRLKTSTSAARVHIDPMDAAESAKLLTTQLGTDREQFTAAHTDQVASLCGGLPLVINLAADRMAHMSTESVAAYVTQLDRRQIVMELGEEGDGSTNARAFFESSYRALPEAERRLFRLLALIPGRDFNITAALACDVRTKFETMSSIGALAGAHLLEQHDSFDRYRFHDLLAEYALHCAELEETADARRDAEQRILGFYLATAINAARILYPGQQEAPPLSEAPDTPSLAFADAAQAKSWFDQERTNLIAAITLSADHAHHEYTWRLADPVATFFDRCGYHDDSCAIRELYIKSARASGRRDAEVSALIGLGMGLMTLGDYQQARRYLDDALRLANEDDFEIGQCAAIHDLARLEMLEGNPTTAIEFYRRSLEIARRTSNLEVQTWTNCRLGQALRSVDQHQEALVCLHAASWSAQQSGDRSAHAASLTEIGNVHKDRGEHDAAAAHCEQAIAIAEAIPDFIIIAQVCIALAEINSARKQPAVAAAYARRAVTLCQQTHNVADEARALEVLGNVEHTDGNLSAAAQTWALARDLYRRAGNIARAALTDTKIDDARHARASLPTSRTLPSASTGNSTIPNTQQQS